VAVKRSIVRKVELYVGDRKTISLHVAAMPPIEPVTLRQLDAALLIGGQRTLQQKFFSVKSDDYRAVCAGRSRERPEAIRSEESLAAAFENDAVRKRVAEKVDFDREQLILFAWNGNSGDRMSAAVDNISDAPKVMFYELPRTGDGFVARSYIFLYVIDKDTKWEVGPAPESDD
jgi:hypothetical protein